MQLCEYGCGQEASFQMKNGKWCCSKSQNSCPAVKIKNSEKNKLKQSGENNGMYGKKHTIESRLKNSESNKKQWRDKNSTFNSPEYRKNLKKSLGKVGKKRRLTIEYIKKKYKFFSQVEEMRYNPNVHFSEREIQVHCKNHNCPNSKEQGGWFTPTKSQLRERIRKLEYYGEDLEYYYCSHKCKDECPMYRSRGTDPFKDVEVPYTSEEYNTWRNEVLKRDNYECQKCESKENLHVHHINPIKIEPGYSLDPSNGITLCENCHYETGHSEEGCKTTDLANLTCKGN